MKRLFTKTALVFVFLLSTITASANSFDQEVDGIKYRFYPDGDTCSVIDCDQDLAGDFVLRPKVRYEGVTYDLTSIGIRAFSYCRSLTSVSIPNSVTSIRNEAFSHCSTLRSVSIPNSVTYIGDWAFYNCSSLTSVNIPNSVKTLGNAVFEGCSSLTTVNIPNSVTTIGNAVFEGCSSLTTVNIPNSVTTIGNSAFYNCSSLTSVNIPNSVTTIGEEAFSDCSSLTSVNIPNSVTTIGEGAFVYCSSLTEINVSENNESFKSIDGVLFNKNTTVLVAFPGGKGGEYTIPNSVTTIGDEAFHGCSSLTSVTIPNSVTYIGSDAFGGCSSLTSVSIPNSVTAIGSNAFWGCKSLTSVSIPNSVTTIGDYAFGGCSSLTEILVSADNKYYKSIDGVLFNKEASSLIVCPCGKRGEYVVPNSVTEIGWGAFDGCSFLTSLTITISIKMNLDKATFIGCDALETVTFTDSNAKYDKNESLLANPNNYLMVYPSLKNVTIDCKEVVINPEFFAYNCPTITLGKDMVEITSSHKYNQNGGAFESCKDLKEIYSLNPVPPVCDKKDFNDATYENAQLYIPKGSLNAYKQYTPWKYFMNIKEFDPSGITKTTNDGFSIAVTDNGLMLNGIDSKAVMVYTADGRQVYATARYAGEQISLRQGLYIVKTDGNVRKVYVK